MRGASELTHPFRALHVLRISYTGCRVVGNGSFGVVFQAKLVRSTEPGAIQGSDEEDDVAIKKVLQDKRFKVSHRFARCPGAPAIDRASWSPLAAPRSLARLPSRRRDLD